MMMLVAAMVLPWATPLAAQQQTVTVGNWSGSTSASSTMLDCNYRNSYTQTLYSEEDMGDAEGYIRALVLDNRSTVGLTFNDISVWIGRAPSATFASISDWVPADSLHLVYTGSGFVIPGSTGQLQIILDSAYYYDGSGNIVVAVSKKQPSYSSSCKVAYTSTTNTFMYRHSDSDESYADYPTASGTRSAYKANIKFLVTTSATEDLCMDLGGLHVVSVGESTVSVAWNNLAGASYEVGITPVGEDNSNTITPIVVTGTSYVFENLDSRSDYVVYARALCGGTAPSAWDSVAASTTSAPTMLPFETDFEDATDNAEWEMISYNNRERNFWCIGPNAYPAADENHALYISNDTNTLAYAYTNTSSAVRVYAGRLLSFDAAGSYDIDFNWRCNGVSTTAYMRAVLIPGAEWMNLEAGTSAQTGFASTTTPATYVALDGGSKLNLSTTWNHLSTTVRVPAAGNYYLCFYWVNSTTAGAPPAAVDSISVRAAACELMDSVVVNNVTETSATVNIFHPTASTFHLQYREMGTVAWTTVSATSVEALTGLAPSTRYEGRVWPVCSDTGRVATTFSFATTCGVIELPWSYGAEDGTWVTATSRTAPYCWNQLDKGSTSYYWNRNTTAANIHDGDGAIYYTGTTSSSNDTNFKDWLFTPVINFQGHEELSFWVRTTSTTATLYYHGRFALYVTSDPDSADLTDTTQFERITLSGTEGAITNNYVDFTGSTWRQVTIQLPTTITGHRRLAFVVCKQSMSFSLDDIYLVHLSDCPTPLNLHAETIGSETLDIAWVDTASVGAYEVLYYAEGQTEEDALTVSVSDTAVQLQNLQPSTTYNIMVRALCEGATASNLTQPIAVTTACLPIDTDSLPWMENFDGMANLSKGDAANMEGGAPPCWDVLGHASSYIALYSATTYRYGESGYSLKFKSGIANTSNYLILPEFELPIDQLELSFQTRPEGTSSSPGTFDVGYMTNVQNAASFVVVEHYSYSDFNGAYQQKIVYFDSVPEGARIAMRHTPTSTSSYWFVDEVQVRVAPTCARPTNAAVANINPTSADVVITDTANIGDYRITLTWQDTLSGVPFDTTMVILTENAVYSLTDLVAGKKYTVSVEALCGDGTSTAPIEVAFHTPCEAIATASLPYVEDFETYASGSSNPIDPCWTKAVFGSTTQYPYPYTTAGITGSLGLYFYGSTTVSSYAAMPLFESDLDAMHVTFKLKRYSTTTSSYGSRIMVGVMTNPDDITTFDTIREIDLSGEAASSVHSFDISLANYTGEGRFIAFWAPKVVSPLSYNHIYLDSVVVDLLPDCRRPETVEATALSDSSVALTWTGDATDYEVQYSSNADFTGASIVSATGLSHVVSGLDGYSYYYFRVRSLCGDMVSDWSDVVMVQTMLDCGDGFVAVTDTLVYGTSTSYGYVIPSYSTYLRGTSWHIFTPEMLVGFNMMDSINYIRSISLQTGTASTAPRPFRIYMAETNLDEWHSSTSATSTTGLNDTIPVSSMQLVYDGSYSFTANSWNDIVLDNAFLYHNNANLVVAFEVDTASPTIYFKYGTTGIANYLTAYTYSTSTSTYAYRSKNSMNAIFNICALVPSCPKPTNVLLTDLGSDNFSLTWNGTSAGYKVVVSTSPVDPDTATTASSLILNTNENGIIVQGLEPATTYYYYVQSLCTGEQSLWTYEGSVTTPCLPKTLPYFESFDNYYGGTAATSGQVIDRCWTKYSSSTTPYPHVFTTQHYSAPNSLRFYSTSSVYSYAAMAQMSDSVKNLTMYFKLRSSTATDGILRVGVMTNPNDISTFTLVKRVKPSASTTWQTFEVDFAGYSGPEGHIAFWAPDSITNYAYLDDIEVYRRGSCLHPTAVAISDTTPNSATVSWSDANNTSLSFDVEYGPAGFAHGEGTLVNTATSPLVLTGLTPATRYEVYVRARCSAEDSSLWALPVQFVTACGAIEPPITFTFESEATGSSAPLPLCWTRYNDNPNGSYGYYPYIYSSSANAHSGSKVAYFSVSTSTGYPTDETLSLPEIDTTVRPMNANEVVFWAKTPTTTANLDKRLVVGIMTNPSNISTFVPIDTVSLTTTLTEFTVPLSSYTGNGAHVAFRITYATGAYYVYLDDITIRMISPCPRVYNLEASNATATTVDLGWTDSTGSTAWKVLWRATNETTQHTFVATTNPVTLTGLSPITTYVFDVAPICANGDTADITGSPVGFTTTQVPATVPYSYDFEDAVEWANWQTSSNINNNSWYRGNIVNGNNTNVMYISTDGGLTHSWNMGVNVNVVAYRDIDFGTDTADFVLNFRAYVGGSIYHNYDGVSVMLVDPALPVQSVNTGLTSPWGHVSDVGLMTVRRDTTWATQGLTINSVSGVKRLVFYHFNQALNDTVQYYDNPSAIDDVSIALSPCQHPTGLAFDGVTTNSAHLTWDGEATDLYQICYRKRGADYSTNEYDTVRGGSYTIVNLENGVYYSAWVRRVCTLTATDTVVSTWSSGVSFETQLCSGSSNAIVTTPTSAAGNVYMPMGSFHRHSHSQQIYFANEIGNAPASISGISFRYEFSTNLNGYSATIYLGHTSDTTVTDWIPTDSLQLVYTGYFNCVNGWNLFKFDQPFEYDGSRNLVVVVDADSTSWFASGYRFYVHNTGRTGAAGYYTNDYTDWTPNVTCTKTTYRNDIRFTFCPVPCNEPTDVTVADTTENTATITWGGSDSTEVMIVAGEWNPNNGTSQVVTTGTITFSDLTSETAYTVGVRNLCRLSNSEWRTIGFTTLRHPCFDPTAVVVDTTTLDGGTVSWTAGEEGQSEFEVRVYNNTYDSTFAVSEATSIVLTGLYSNTDYNVVVRAVCGEDYYSEWTEPIVLTPSTCVAPTGVTATAEGREVTVSWQGTGAERYRVTYYDEFSTIANATTVDVEGATSTTVTVPEGGMDYSFYVQAYCGDALSTYSDPATVSIVGIEAVEGMDVSLYPNPASGSVTLSGIEGPATVTVVDLNGRESGRWQVNEGSLTIDLGGYAKGAYFVRIAGERAVTVRKLVVR